MAISGGTDGEGGIAMVEVEEEGWHQVAKHVSSSSLIVSFIRCILCAVCNTDLPRMLLKY